MSKVEVSNEALRQVLQALIGPGHLIRELQVCHGIPAALSKPGDDPIGTLITEFNDAAHAKQVKAAATLNIGGKYNWKNQPERLIYIGKKGNWHQFKKIGDDRDVWCEVLDSDLHMIEETK